MKGGIPTSIDFQKKIDEANLLIHTNVAEGRKQAYELEKLSDNIEQVSINEQAKSIILSSYYVIGDTDSLRDYIELYWSNLKDYNSEIFKGVLFQHRTHYLILTKQIEEAKETINKAIKIFDCNNDHKRVIQCYFIQGSIYNNANEIVESYKAYLKFLNCCDDFPEFKGSYYITALLNMGFLFIHAKDYEEALKIMDNGLRLINDSGESYPYMLLTTYVNQALCKLHLNKIDEMPAFLKLAGEMEESLDSDYYKSQIYPLWGEYYFHKEDYSKAEEYLFLTTKGKLSSNEFEFFESDHYFVMYCKILSKLGRFSEVENLLEDYSVFLEKQNIDFAKEIEYERMAALYAAEGKYELACKYYEKWIDISSVLKVESDKLKAYKIEHTERIKAKREEYKYKEAIDQKNIELSNFIRMASHDMKAPIRNIKQFGELMERNTVDSEQKEYLSFIKESSEKMNRLLEDLLEYTNVGFIKDNLSTVDMPSLLNLIIADFDSHIEQSQIKIHLIDIMSFKSDEKTVQTLIRNMIDHCITMTKPEVDSYIKVSCRDLDDYIQIVFEDNGIGIDQTQLENIFDPFTRLELGVGHSENSLKLATCKRIVEKLGGQIAVESEKNLGSRFLISLPKK